MAQENYAILATNNGSGLYTLSVKKGASLSGGTALLGGGSNLVSAVSTTSVAAAIENGKLVAENDRAANG